LEEEGGKGIPLLKTEGGRVYKTELAIPKKAFQPGDYNFNSADKSDLKTQERNLLNPLK